MNDTSLRAELLEWADILARGTGSVPAVDVAWKLRELAGATPTTGPAPAADGPMRGLIDASNLVNFHQATRCAGCNAADQWWCSCPEGYEPPAAPQAPAQPTELPSALLAATLTDLAITQAELARRTGISTKHINRVIQGKAGLGVDLANALAEVTGVPAARWLHAEANRLSGPAAREDTAPPDPVVHDITLKTKDGYTSARCSNCGLIAGDFDSEWVKDRVDSHRADNLIPARPSAPPVDGDTPPCTNDLGEIHPSEPGYVINEEPYCRECFDSCGPFDDEPGVSQEGGKP